MAAFNYDDYGASDENGTFTAILNWGGAILSLVLIAGLATWGWKLWQRDVTGVPVVRALEGPMRVAPDDPGGLASEYQGLTVNRIAESNVENTPSEQVVLAPAPATLDEEEDLAMAELPAVAPEPQLDVASVSVETAGRDDFETVVVAPASNIGEAETVSMAEDDEIVEQAVASAASPEPVRSAIDVAVAAALADSGLRPEPAVLKLDRATSVPTTSPRPVIRPSDLMTVSLSAPAAPEGEVDVTAIPAGTRLVQLGAFATADDARTEWLETEARYGDYFAGKSRVVQKVESGGREFFRLRVMGFDDLSDARRFCAVIVADGTNCIPVIHQ